VLWALVALAVLLPTISKQAREITVSRRVLTTITALVVVAVLALAIPTTQAPRRQWLAVMVVLVVARLVGKLAPRLPVVQESLVSGLPVALV
tara:strand:- start:445 stop:720 length:276 start_codon:yes stop_codon:yes gene_type:complete